MSIDITAYCIKEPNKKYKGHIKVDTICYNKGMCIQRFCDGKWEWKDLYKIGWRCVKVEIKVLTKLDLYIRKELKKT